MAQVSPGQDGREQGGQRGPSPSRAAQQPLTFRCQSREHRMQRGVMGFCDDGLG